MNEAIKIKYTPSKNGGMLESLEQLNSIEERDLSI